MDKRLVSVVAFGGIFAVLTVVALRVARTPPPTTQPSPVASSPAPTSSGGGGELRLPGPGGSVSPITPPITPGASTPPTTAATIADLQARFAALGIPWPTAPTSRPGQFATAALAELKTAIDLQRREDLVGARAAYEKARTLEPALRGIDFQLATVALAEKSYDEATARALASITRAEDVYGALRLLGVIAARRDDTPRAAALFELATRVNPGDAWGFYDWSEALRALGRPLDAAEKLRVATLRKPDEVLFAFKRRLALIDAGRTADLADDLRFELAQPKPAGDWLLTAAAVALAEQRFADAAIALDRARDRMTAQLFFTLIQDTLFTRHSTRPEIAPFYSVEITRTTAPASRPAP